LDHRQWRVLPLTPAGCLSTSGLPPLANQLLYNRGITDPAHARAFLSVDESLHSDPFLMPDMEQAVSRLYQAMLRGETVAIYGDFDADGVCGTALLVEGLTSLGAKVVPYIPHRVEEGYGLNTASLENLAGLGVSLVVTVDCGISNVSEVAEARRKGLDVIVTDHHTITTELPPAFAVLNPKRIDPGLPFYQLAGVGVAFKLLQALLRTLGREGQAGSALDLVTVGTVADMVPLVGENRYLVRKGMESLCRTSRLGLQAMAEVAALKMSSLDANSISWAIAPRLNAPGRLDHALTSYRLLMTESAEEARFLAEELERKNYLRQRLTEEYLARAKSQLPSGAADLPLLMVGGEGYPSGLAGLIAGKLADEFYRPTFVFEVVDGTARGSARSIPDFDVVAALSRCGDLLTRFGGHPGAAGFALPVENLAVFERRLMGLAERELAAIDLRPFLIVDTETRLSGIQGRTFRMVEKFAPFGKGNPVPTFLSRQVKVADAYRVGGGSQHLKMKLRDDNVTWRAIAFDLGRFSAEVTSEIDVVYNLVVDRWNDRETLALNVLDFAPASFI
jgi:single-stranded-DNA-specific exonuclease